MTRFRIKIKSTSLSIIFLGVIIVCIPLFSCIEEYETGIDIGSNLLTIDAGLVKNQDTQTVVITRSAGINEAVFTRVKGCNVLVEDELGNTLHYTEQETGEYSAFESDNFLVLNRKYRLRITIPDGDTYQSGFETLYNCAPIDSIYARDENIYSNTTGTDMRALQFYVDLKAAESDTRYYRWTIKEDWEYKVPYSFHGIWDGDTLLLSDHLDNSLKTCYKQANVSGIYCASTENLSTNNKKMIPLNALFAGSEKVSNRYSILLSQYSLSKEAYAYWEQIKASISESGGLYAAQPSQAASNIKNINDESETVLGYFWVGTKTIKRALYNQRFGYDEYYTCPKDTFNVTTYKGAIPAYLLMYISGSDTTLVTSNIKCFDCTASLGKREVPDFWKD